MLSTAGAATGAEVFVAERRTERLTCSFDPAAPASFEGAVAEPKRAEKVRDGN